MTYLKASLAVFFILVCILIGHLILTFESEPLLNTASKAFLTGNDQEAEKLLQEIKDEIPPAQYHLYQAYLYRDKGQLEASNQHLLKAIASETPKHLESSLLLEIYLNQAFNAYLDGNHQEMASAIANAKKIAGTPSGWLQFFTGLFDYSTQNFSNALSHWQEMSEPKPMSPWMEKAFNQRFTPFWLAMKMIRSEIEGGEYRQARLDLEQETIKATPEQLKTIHFLFGLSYVKEAQGKSPQAAEPFYKLALSYFTQVPIALEPFIEERNTLVKGLQNNLFTLMEQRSFQNLPFYVSALEKLNATSQLNEVSEKLAALLDQEITSHHWNEIQEIVPLLNGILTQEDLRHHLQDRFQNLVWFSLESGDFSPLNQNWQALLTLSPHVEDLKSKAAEITKKKIVEIAPTDDSTLTKSKPYFIFWHQIEPSSQERYAFAIELIELAKSSWDNHNPPKAFELLKTALATGAPEDQKPLLNIVENQIDSYYQKARVLDTLEQLPFILETVQQLNLTGIAIQDKKEIERQLDEAQTLYANKQYHEAKAKACWVLHLEPTNQNALQIIGMSDYQETEYAEALFRLKFLSSPNSEAKEALAVSEILVGDREKGEDLLNELANENAISREAYLHLGFGSMIVNNSQDSVMWLSKATPLNKEAIAGMAFADYLNQHWGDAVRQLGQLNHPPFNKLWGLEGARVVSYIGLGQIGQAEERLSKMLAMTKEPSSREFSYLFSIFKGKVIDQLNRDFVAGNFYKNVKKDYSKALRYFNTLSNPSPEVLFEKAETYLALNLKEEALLTLEKFQEKTKNRFSSVSLYQKAFSLLGSLYFSQTLYPEAVQAYTQYFALDSNNLTQRPLFAKALMHIQRYDLALDQYRILEQANRLSFDHSIGFIESLVHTGQFEQANHHAKMLLSQNPPLSLLDRLKIAHQMIITRNEPLVETVLQHVPANNQLSLKNNQELMNIWLSLGEYEKAIKLAKSNQLELEKSVSGMMALAKLQVSLSRFKDALELAYKAKNLNPNDTLIEDFISKYEFRPDFVKISLEHLKKKMAEFPHRVSWQLAYARSLIDFSVENLDFEPTHSSELQQALALLERLSLQNQEIPEISFLLGKTYLLSDNTSSAISHFNQALKLDVSYVEAYKYLALALNEDSNQSVSLLKDALKFSPEDAEAWQQIGLFYQKEENKVEATTAYKNAIKYRPNDPSTYVQLAKLYLDENKPEEAKTSLEKALVLEPNNVPALKLLLITLHDPDLNDHKKNPGSLGPKQRAVYQTLYNLSPDEAEALISELS